MGRFQISVKLFTVLALLMAIIALTGLFAMQKIGEVDALSGELRGRWLPAAQSLGDIHAYLSQYRIKQRDLIDAPSDRKQKLLRNAQLVVDGLLDDYEKHVDDRQKAQLGMLRQSWNAYTDQNVQLTELAQRHDPAALALFQGDAQRAFYAIEDNVLAMIDQDGKAAVDVSNRSAQIYASARAILTAAIIGGLCVALTLLLLLMVNIARPLALMSAAVGRLISGDMRVELPGIGRSDEIGALARALDQYKALVAADAERAAAQEAHAIQAQATIDAIGGGLAALAAGDLGHRVPETGEGALAKLHVDYNTAVGELSAVLAKIVDGCTTIQTGTMEISAAANDLAVRSEHQASSLAETARTLGEFTGTVRITADNARQTSGRLDIARNTAATVETTARKAIEAMRSIEGSSREMSDIVAVIDGIAFQTNLLALNAGVEAARAGESGRGFAVVATEVRALAQRSAEAAKDIKTLISTSTEQIGGGVSLVASSGDALRQIVGEVSAVSDLVSQIAEAAEKQATGIAEISDMVSSMDRFTQANAAMVEQTSAGTRNLSEETTRLMARLRRFRVDQEPPLRGSWHDEDHFAEAPYPSDGYRAPQHIAHNLQPRPAYDRSAALHRQSPAPAALPDGEDWSEF